MSSLRLVGFLAVAVLGACAHPSVVSTAVPAAGSQGSLDAELVSDFQRRAARYMQLHDKIQKQGTPQKQRDDIGENLVSQQALAMRIRFARHDARPGDLFTPAIALALRRALDPEIRGLAALRVRESIREDAPATFVLAVNGSFPEGGSRSTMPGNVLRILPTLPNGLEYRIIDTHLVLIDLEADVVVDYMLDIMCSTC
jgi:hypothetical protein